MDFSDWWLRHLLWNRPNMNVTGQSTLVQVMAWCRQATSHYLSQCWPRSLSPYGVTRPLTTLGSCIICLVSLCLMKYLVSFQCLTESFDMFINVVYIAVVIMGASKGFKDRNWQHDIAASWALCSHVALNWATIGASHLHTYITNL